MSNQNLLTCIGCQYHTTGIDLLLEAGEGWQDDITIKRDFMNVYNEWAIGFYYKDALLGYVADDKLDEFYETWVPEGEESTTLDTGVKVVDVNYVQYTDRTETKVKWMEFIVE